MTITLTDVKAEAVYGGGGSQWTLQGASKPDAIDPDGTPASGILWDQGGTGIDAYELESAIVGAIPLGSMIRTMVARVFCEATSTREMSIGANAYGSAAAYAAAQEVQTGDQTLTYNITLTDLLQSASIYVYIRGEADEVGWLLVDWAEFDINYSPAPNAPTLVSPLGGTVGTTPTLTVTSSNPTGGDAITDTQYEVRRNSDNILMWDSGWKTGLDELYAGTTLQAGVTYKWRARNRNTYNAVGAWSAYSTFTPAGNTNPTVSQVSPSNGATVGSLTPTFQWSFSDADGDTQASYQLEVRRKSDQTPFWTPGIVVGSASSVVYAGTTLVTTTTYQWRIRVTDSRGGVSAYTGWYDFTPAATPNPPTLTSPNGLTNTLTPTVSGAYNQGTGGAQASYQYQIRQGGATIYDSGEVAGAFATGQAYGTNNASDTPATPPALAWGTTYEIRARSKDAAGVWSDYSSYLAFHTNAAPTTPTGLSPSNGAITGDTTPAISWVHNDSDGDAQTKVQIELRKVSDDSVVTGYGPKELTQATLTHDVTETLSSAPTEYKYRVRTMGLAGPGYGPWSEFRNFTVATAPVVSVSSPTVDEGINSPAWTFMWSLSGGSGTQQSYRVIIYAADTTTVVFDTTEIGSAVDEYTLASGILKNNLQYYREVILEDTLSQQASSGKAGFTTSWTPPDSISGISLAIIGDQS